MIKRNPSSFRDPSGYIFEQKDQIYRYVDGRYGAHFDHLTNSGLLKKLFDKEMLISHEIVRQADFDPSAYAIIKPEMLPVISYPYEWSFGQLKDAALLTLDVLEQSLKDGMILKDASAFNVQFKGHKTIFIDTLSFAIYQEGQPWYGYKQFCEHFLTPLCLSSYLDQTLISLNKLNVDGVPIRIASKLLPLKTWFHISPLFHIHLHSRSIEYYVDKRESKSKTLNRISKKNLFALVNSLKDSVERLQLPRHTKTQWGKYYLETHYVESSRLDKAELLKEFVYRVNPSVVWDIGANDGFFSRAIATEKFIVLSLDFDLLAVESNYQTTKKTRNNQVYPLLYDIVNPSADIGWANKERGKLTDRSKPDLIIALAVIHHLVITFNIPFEEVASYFSSLVEWLIIEFVPKEDEKIDLLPNTAGKESYSRASFQKGFLSFFEFVDERKIKDSERSILLLRKRK